MSSTKCKVYGLAPTSGVIQWNSSEMHAQFILRENIKALLKVRQQDASALSGWLRHDKSWINKILNGHRDMQIEDFDRVADFFGIATYQLFQPGIGRATERRTGHDRRVGKERRISQSKRVMLELTAELDKARPPATGKGRHASAAVVDPIQRILERAREEIRRVEMANAGRQAPVARKTKTPVRPKSRSAGESDHSVVAPKPKA